MRESVDAWRLSPRTKYRFSGILNVVTPKSFVFPWFSALKYGSSSFNPSGNSSFLM